MLIDYINRAEFLHKLYPNDLQLNNVEVAKIELEFDGMPCLISIHSSQLPNQTPKNWIEEYNRIALDLHFSEIKHLNIKGWGADNKCKININRSSDGLLNVKVKGDECNMDMVVGWIDFSAIRPFLVNEDSRCL